MSGHSEQIAGRRQKSSAVISAILALIFFNVLPVPAQFRFDSWTADDGLPQNSVYSIAQTGDGYLWFTTLDGLVRFDGVRFKVFNKSNSTNFNINRLKYIFADDDTLWIATENGGLIRRLNGQFKTFTVADGLPSNDVNEFQKDADGSLLIFTVNGIARTRDGGATFTVERAEDIRNFHSLAAASGVVWEINRQGLHVLRNGVSATYPLPFAAENIAADRIFNVFGYIPLFEDRRGALWFAAAGNLYRFQAGEFATFSAADGMPASRARTIAEDAAGDIWFGTEKDGACRLAAGRVVCYGIAAGLSSNHVLDIFLDRENTLWFGTNDAGLNRVSKQIVKPLSAADGLLDKNVYPILQTRAGDVWIGTTSALSHFQNEKITNYAEPDGLLYPNVQSLFEDRNGRLWIGGIGGVEHLENGKFTDFTGALGLAAGVYDFRDIHQTADGALWFASNFGLLKYAGGTVERFSTENGLPGNDVNTILEARDGSLWIGTASGVAQFKNNRFTAYTERDGLAGNFIRSIYEDANGLLWFGTYDSGLSLLRGGKFVNFNTSNGLFSNGVFAILPDEKGNFWMSSNQGIYRAARQQLIDYADGKIPAIVSTAFGKSDGMLSTECNGGRQPAAIRAADGKLWFATQNGAAIVDPNAVGFNPLAPPVVIEDVLIDNQPVENSASEIVIEPNQNNVEIRYTATSFVKPEQIRFRYKLAGLDENWTEAGERRTAYFPYLPPGEYVFTVIATNADGVWNTEGKSTRLRVVPPFYRTNWFAALCVLAAFGLATLGYRFRLRQIERRHREQNAFSRKLIDSQEQERKRIAAELHDSIGQLLVIIKNRARMGLKSGEIEAATAEHLDEISTASSQAIEEVKEISFDLRPYLLDKLGLTKTIKSMLTKVFASSEMKLETDIDDVDGFFPKDSEILFYRIVQETASNVVKHARAGNAEVTIKRSEKNITLRVRDDGHGFDSAAQANSANRSFGLIGIAERARLLGGTHSIVSEIGKGTTATIEIVWRAKK